MLGSERRATKGAIEKRFREYAEQTSFVDDKDMNGYNPARPHSLRAAFRSRLTGKMDGDLIEFLMGHAISEVKRTYMNLPTDELRDIYASFEKRLAIEKTSRDEISEIDKKEQITQQLNEKVDNLEGAVSRLAEENEALRGKINQLEDLAHGAKALLDYLEGEGIIPKWLADEIDKERSKVDVSEENL